MTFISLASSGECESLFLWHYWLYKSVRNIYCQILLDQQAYKNFN